MRLVENQEKILRARWPEIKGLIEQGEWLNAVSKIPFIFRGTEFRDYCVLALILKDKGIEGLFDLYHSLIPQGINTYKHDTLNLFKSCYNRKGLGVYYSEQARRFHTLRIPSKRRIQLGSINRIFFLMLSMSNEYSFIYNSSSKDYPHVNSIIVNKLIEEYATKKSLETNV